MNELHRRIDNDFVYHPPRAEQIEKYAEIRDRAREYAHFLVDTVPPGRELELALTALDSVVFNANAGIARG